MTPTRLRFWSYKQERKNVEAAVKKTDQINPCVKPCQSSQILMNTAFFPRRFKSFFYFN